MRPFDLAIFDCDGVLFDSKEANRAYYNAILARFSRGPMNEDEMAYIHMHTAEQSVRHLFRDDEDACTQAIIFAKGLDYSGYLHLLKMEPGVTETVSAIRPYIRTAIFTNRGTTMPKLREIFGLDSLFDSILCALDVRDPKPHPEGILKILGQMGIEGQRAVYIGDSPLDEQAAKRAGVRLMAYKNESLDAMFHVKHFHEIKTILLSA
ncbi:MAG: HAD hydrolase-like protein [Desulfobacteraceae bacterium]|nr:HAD hydrolase-like protein [Desulfobacteraceae bacterium]